MPNSFTSSNMSNNGQSGKSVYMPDLFSSVSISINCAVSEEKGVRMPGLFSSVTDLL